MGAPRLFNVDVVLGIFERDVQDFEGAVDIRVAVRSEVLLGSLRRSSEGMSPQLAIRQPWLVAVTVADGVERQHP